MRTFSSREKQCNTFAAPSNSRNALGFLHVYRIFTSAFRQSQHRYGCCYAMVCLQLMNSYVLICTSCKVLIRGMLNCLTRHLFALRQENEFHKNNNLDLATLCCVATMVNLYANVRVSLELAHFYVTS